MSNITKILMERDDLSEEEAEDLQNECREALADGNFEAMQDFLGLEDDYIFDLLF